MKTWHILAILAVVGFFGWMAFCKSPIGPRIHTADAAGYERSGAGHYVASETGVGGA